jgi:hypothetical protein
MEGEGYDRTKHVENQKLPGRAQATEIETFD